MHLGNLSASSQYGRLTKNGTKHHGVGLGDLETAVIKSVARQSEFVILPVDPVVGVEKATKRYVDTLYYHGGKCEFLKGCKVVVKDSVPHLQVPEETRRITLANKELVLLVMQYLACEALSEKMVLDPYSLILKAAGSGESIRISFTSDSRIEMRAKVDLV